MSVYQKELQETIAHISPVSLEVRKQAKQRLDQLTMPHWALGRLLDLALDLAGMLGEAFPSASTKELFQKKAIVVMAGDHGITEEGVSLYPSEVTVQMVYNMLTKGAGINAMALDTDVYVADIGVRSEFKDCQEHPMFLSYKVGPGTQNFLKTKAMSREQAVESLVAGVRIAQRVGKQVGVLGTGDMGIGNTTASSAILCGLTDCSVEEAVGPGTGLDKKQVEHKQNILSQALGFHKVSEISEDPVELLSCVGGYEIGALAGYILGAAALKKPLVIDGFISTAGAMLAKALCPASTEYMILAHRSQEPGHVKMMQYLEKEPYLDLGFRLGEGTGAAVFMPILDRALALLTEVRTFEEAAVSTVSEKA